MDGFVNFVYIADLDGRVYRLDVSTATSRPGRFRPSTRIISTIHRDQARRLDEPSESVPKRPHVYFGTGGHDRNLGDYNPNTDELGDRTFSFVSVVDNLTGPRPMIGWNGTSAIRRFSRPADIRDVGDLGVGSRVWADPVIADLIIYFSTLVGSIESANPCINLGEGGHLYARFIRRARPSRRRDGLPGDRRHASEYLQLMSKARQAVTMGEAAYDETNQVNRREVYVQEYDSTIQQLVQPSAPCSGSGLGGRSIGSSGDAPPAECPGSA